MFVLKFDVLFALHRMVICWERAVLLAFRLYSLIPDACPLCLCSFPVCCPGQYVVSNRGIRLIGS